jgi:2-polyprenyl-6-hydroxyphenyl methylase/3-demethylubiquinone-9 3-methyltransferase
MDTHTIEIEKGERFAFGANWKNFLERLNDDRIHLAEQSLLKLRGGGGVISGKRFLVIGSGSGLFSLAARRLGATVHSFDYDPNSVACTAELRRRYFPDDPDWRVEQGSVLDKEYLGQLGTFDIVYSWGVLHHTGALYQALENVVPLVKPEGMLFISIYNHQRIQTPIWIRIKHAYNRLPSGLRWILLFPSLIYLWGPRTLFDILRGKPFHTWRHYAERSLRGMSAWHDVVDWVGGYPFEATKPEDIFRFFHARGFSLEHLFTCGAGNGCNEFIFKKVSPSAT